MQENPPDRTHFPKRKWFREVVVPDHVARNARRRGFTVIELLIVVMMIGTLTAIGIPVYATALGKAKITRAIADISTFDREVRAYQLLNGSLPATLADIGRANWRDPYGNPYEYLNIADGGPGLGNVRKDQSLVPLNSDFDLYSKGQDADSKPPLTAQASHDDIVRANDGGFVGLASEY
ncbi:MAG: type II secretion system protein [Candidatus Methylomirabilales bacterium]